MSRPFCLHGNIEGSKTTGDWVCHNVGLDVSEKRKSLYLANINVIHVCAFINDSLSEIP